MGITLIDKIVPKNDAFVGMVDAAQVLGIAGSELPDGALKFSNVNQFIGSLGHNNLSGLALGDVHTQYLLTDGTRELTGIWSAGSFRIGSIAKPINIADAATKEYVDDTAGGGGAGVNMLKFTGNGPFKTATEVDGAWVIDSNMDISAVWLWRGTSGTVGSTVLDVHKNGTTMYTTQVNRPTIQFNDADLKVDATIPDVTAISGGDIITIDIDNIEGGKPQDMILVIQGS